LKGRSKNTIMLCRNHEIWYII